MAQAFKRSLIVSQMVRLAQDRLFPRQAQPGEVFVDRRLVLWSAAGGVDILDAQDEATARRLRRVIGHQRRKGVAEMKQAGGGGRKSSDEAGRQRRPHRAENAPVRFNSSR